MNREEQAAGSSMEVCARQITKEYYRKKQGSNVFTALEACSISLRPGTLTVVRGRSGSGKSTLLNALAGILTPTGGQVEYDGKDIYAMKDEERSLFRGRFIGCIPQGRSAHSALSVLDNVLLPLTLIGERDEKRAVELLERFSIADLKDMNVKKLSGGELRRMAIARALMRDPEVVFADEPTGDLDDENTRLVFEELKKIAASGKTVFIVTHEDGAEAYADRVLTMENGRLQDE